LTCEFVEELPSVTENFIREPRTLEEERKEENGEVNRQIGQPRSTKSQDRHELSNLSFYLQLSKW
jgi:hypothetical protein